MIGAQATKVLFFKQIAPTEPQRGLDFDDATGCTPTCIIEAVNRSGWSFQPTLPTSSVF